MAAATQEMTKRRLMKLLGTVQAGDTPEKQDAAWDEIIGAFHFDQNRSGALANPLIFELCRALKGRLDGLGYQYDGDAVDRWFSEYGEDPVWFYFIAPVLDHLEDKVSRDLMLETPQD